MVGWHHWLDGYEFEQASEVGEGQGGMACYSPWGCKELKMTERLNWIGHTPWQILFVIGMFIQQDWGSLRPQHLSPVMSLPMNRSQCLAFTRHSVSADCSGTSILVDIEEQRTHLSSCLKQLQIRQDKWKISFLYQISGSREWIPAGVGEQAGEFYNCPNSGKSLQHIHGVGI